MSHAQYWPLAVQVRMVSSSIIAKTSAEEGETTTALTENSIKLDKLSSGSGMKKVT